MLSIESLAVSRMLPYRSQVISAASLHAILDIHFCTDVSQEHLRKCLWTLGRLLKEETQNKLNLCCLVSSPVPSRFSVLVPDLGLYSLLNITEHFLYFATRDSSLAP